MKNEEWRSATWGWYPLGWEEVARFVGDYLTGIFEVLTVFA
jgi:hypothetical protein